MCGFSRDYANRKYAYKNSEPASISAADSSIWPWISIWEACQRHGYGITAASVIKFTANNSRFARSSAKQRNGVS